MRIAGAALLVLIAISGFAVVRTRDVTAQIISLSFYGLLTALMFFFFQAPDVALSEITVGAVALPLMVMLAIARMRFHSSAREAQASADGGGAAPSQRGPDRQTLEQQNPDQQGPAA